MSGSEIQRSELWEVSQRLIGFDTVSAKSNVEATEYLANYLQGMGFQVQHVKENDQGVQKGSVIAWIGPAEPDGLIISGHTDVVPFEGQPGWKSDPLKLQIDGDKLIARGVSDMKVFLAQALMAAKNQSLKDLKRPLVFIFTHDEEVAGQGAGRLKNKLPEIFKDFPMPKIALIGEPTDFQIFPAHKGYAVFDILVHGRGGHSSLPEKGINAIERMADVIEIVRHRGQELREQASVDNQKLFPESPATTFNYGLIEGGLAPNMIAETCKLTVSVRIAPGDKIEEITQHLQKAMDQQIAGSMRKQWGESVIKIENLIAVPPMTSPIDSAFSRCLSEITGKSVAQGAPYATDGGQFEPMGIHSYICGPGALDQAHQPNESLPIANFTRGQELVEKIIRQWCIER